MSKCTLNQRATFRCTRYFFEQGSATFSSGSATFADQERTTTLANYVARAILSSGNTTFANREHNLKATLANYCQWDTWNVLVIK